MIVVDENNMASFGATEISVGRIAVAEKFPELPALFNVGAILYCEKGMVKITLSGKEYVVGPQDLLFITPGKEVGGAVVEGSFALIMITYAEMARTAVYHVPIQLLRTLQDSPLMKITAKDETVATTYRLLITQVLNSDIDRPYREQMISSLADSFVYELLNMISSSDTMPVACHPLFTAFIDQLEKGAGRQRSVKVIADHLCVSAKHLARTVKENSGWTPTEWIDRYTLRDVVHYLRFTNLSIKEIAHLCGFTSAASFGRFVRQHLGDTPVEYRKRYR